MGYLTDEDRADIKAFFDSPVDRDVSDGDVLDLWYKVMEGVVARHDEVPCRHDLNSAAVGARLDRINKMANEKCRHGVVFAEDCGDCWSDV